VGRQETSVNATSTITQTELMKDILAQMPPASARGAQLISDLFTREVMHEIKDMTVTDQIGFWAGAYLVLAANIKGATNVTVYEAIVEMVRGAHE
jgi:hypothetical protein